MLGVLKKACSLCMKIWLYLFHVFRHKSVQTSAKNVQQTEQAHGDGMEKSWEESGWGDDNWEEFSVKVIPNAEEESQLTNHSDADQDLFRDMVPVFKKTKTISVRQATGSRDDHVDMNKFAVQNSFQNEGYLGELGVWNEDKDTDAWEEELIPDEGELIQSSMATVKEKRRLEREKRRAAQELLRTQQKTVGRHPQFIGTKVS